jgi:hypothetical protein
VSTAPRGPRRGRITYREQMQRNQTSLDLYADLAGKPRMVIPVPPEPKKRAPREPSGVPPVPLERDVQRAIIDGLRMHPMIGLVERVNSGQATETDAAGNTRYIQFHHVYSVAGVRMRSVDLHCTLKPSGRRFVIEVKRPGWKAPRDERERAQQAYIAHIIACGGFGMFASSWDEVANELRRIASCLTTPQRTLLPALVAVATAPREVRD